MKVQENHFAGMLSSTQKLLLRRTELDCIISKRRKLMEAHRAQMIEAQEELAHVESELAKELRKRDCTHYGVKKGRR